MHAIYKLLQNKQNLQLATHVGGSPWVCTVIYVVDEDLNFYWASIPSRRHSKEVKQDGRSAIAVVVDDDLKAGVIGVQAEGQSVVLTNENDIRPFAEMYAKKFNRSREWIEKISRGETEHELYKFTPSKIVLFDEQNSKDSPRQEFIP